jgi:flavorubredoxin
VNILSIWAIIGIIIGILILILVIAWIIGYSRSSGSKTIKPDGAITGKALIVYDPGFTGGTKTAASHMAEDLKSKGYEVKVVGVRSSDASDLSGYDVLIVGSPTYGAKPTGPINSYLDSLKSPGNIIAGVFALAGGDAQDSNVVMAQMLKEKSVTVKVSVKYGKSAFGASADRSQYSDFVSQLLA